MKRILFAYLLLISVSAIAQSALQSVHPATFHLTTTGFLLKTVVLMWME
ncbi:hypothetical protein [Segetibacter koreensis]|nr:hypothetical protein [Segetibacter koreensis]